MWDKVLARTSNEFRSHRTPMSFLDVVDPFNLIQVHHRFLIIVSFEVHLNVIVLIAQVGVESVLQDTVILYSQSGGGQDSGQDIAESHDRLELIIDFKTQIYLKVIRDGIHLASNALGINELTVAFGAGYIHINLLQSDELHIVGSQIADLNVLEVFLQVGTMLQIALVDEGEMVDRRIIGVVFHLNFLRGVDFAKLELANVAVPGGDHRSVKERK